MRVLWFSPTGGLFGHGVMHGYNGGGWIEGLQMALVDQQGIDLGIAFLTKGNFEFKIKESNTIYYPIHISMQDKIWGNMVDGVFKYKNFVLSIINDFKPDLIHLFGTEQWFSYIPAITYIPCVVHLQGLVAPIKNAYLPVGMNERDYSGLGLTFLFNYLRGNARKYKQVESIAWNCSIAFLGRTAFDHNVSDLLSGGKQYFHIDEILRAPFYNSSKWQFKDNNTVQILSIITPASYKGLDVVLKTSQVLKKHDINFIWNIVGLSEDHKFTKKFEKFYKISGRDNNIAFHGFKSSKELVNMLLGCSLYVHPSYIDNSPNSICEAQMLGVPVLACNVGGVSSLIENNVTGWLVPSNGVYEIAYFIKHYKELNCNEISLNEIKFAGIRHNKEKIVANLMTAYKEISNI